MAGIERYPHKVTKRMSQKKIERKTKVKPFIKFVNYNHMIPTRYMVASTDMDLKATVTEDKLATKESKKTLKKEVRKIFQEKYVHSPHI